MASRHGACPGATPGSRTIPFSIDDLRLPICFAMRAIEQAARQHAAESPKLSSLRAARRQPANS